MHLNGCTNLKSITIPNNVTIIKDFAFLESGLTNINVIGYNEAPEGWEEKWNILNISSDTYCDIIWNYQE